MRVSLVDTNLDGERLSGPFFSVDDPDETLIQIGHCFYHTSRCMVVLQGETDEAVMHAPKGYQPSLTLR